MVPELTVVTPVTRLGSRRLSLGYALLAVGLAASAPAAFVLGARGSPAPRLAGTYTSRSACLSGPAGGSFTIAQSGRFVDLHGGPGGSFRLHGGVLRGTVRCRDGAGAAIELAAGPGGRVTGTVAGARIALAPLPAATPAGSALTGEDAVGRLLLAMAVVIVCARLAGSALARVGQPRVIGEVLAGILLGPTLLGAVWPSAQHYVFAAALASPLNGLSQVGLVLYLFLVGMEFDPRLLRGRLGQALFVSNTCVAVPLGLGLLAAVPVYRLLAPSGVRFAAFGLFFAVALSITAFPVLARILEERRMLGAPVGALTLTASAVGDVTAWGLVALALAFVHSGSGLGALGVIGWTLLFVAVMVALVRPFLGRAAVAYAEVGELPIVWTGSIFVAVLLSGFAAQRAGVAPIFGAFVMGSVMPRNAGLTTDVSRRIDDFVGLLLLPLFFAVSGLQVDLTGIDDGLLWAVAFGILALAVIGKFGAGFLAARYLGFSGRDSGVIGALMNTRGLTELIVLNIALGAGAISPKLYAILVAMAIVTTAMAGPLLRLLDPRHELAEPTERRLDSGSPAQRSIVVALQDERHLDVLTVIAEALARAEPPHELVLVEALRPRGLVAGRLRDQDDVARANERLEDRRRLLASAGVAARAAAFGSADPTRDYLRIASRERVDVLLVDGRRPLFGDAVVTGEVAQLLDEAPCGVAVLVARSDVADVGSLQPIAVPFGGAEHDWAALELAVSVASAQRGVVRLVGAGGDASELLLETAAIVRSLAGVEVETTLAPHGEGVAIVEATAGAGLAVVGLANDWRRAGVGAVREEIARNAATPVLLVRGGRGTGALVAAGRGLTRPRSSPAGEAPPSSPDAG